MRGSHVAKTKFGLSQLGGKELSLTTNGKKKSDRGANHIAEIQEIAETHPQQLKKNCPKITEKEKEADSDDDDSLDDECWFLKHGPRWSVPVKLTGDILHNPVELFKFLESLKVKQLAWPK